jgi:hypothetical protein
VVIPWESPISIPCSLLPKQAPQGQQPAASKTLGFPRVLPSLSKMCPTAKEERGKLRWWTLWEDQDPGQWDRAEVMLVRLAWGHEVNGCQ